jgi:hypothetical protein
MPKHMPTLGAVLMAAVVAWVGWTAPLAWAQRARVPQTGQTQCWDASGTLVPCAGTGHQDIMLTGSRWYVA